MANTTWDKVVKDAADGIRTLLGTSSTIPVGELKGKLTGITRKGAATYTPSTSAQTIAAGQYLAGTQTIAAMPNGALSDVSVSSSGLITQQVGTSGYLASGTKKTKQLTTQAAKTITPSSSVQTAVASGVYTTGAVTVAAVPTETKTVTPTTSVQTITPSSGKYLSSVTVGASSIDVVNGVIQEYYAATENISANTFIEFVESYSSQTKILEDDTMTDIRAIKLTDSKVIVAYRLDDDSKVYAAVVSIGNNNTVTVGALSSNLGRYSTSVGYELARLTDTVAIMAHRSNGRTYVFTLTVNGTTITKGTSLSLASPSSTYATGTMVSIARLTDTTALVLYESAATSSKETYSLSLLTISSSGTITKTTTTTFNKTDLYSGERRPMVTLSNNKVFMLYDYEKSLYGCIVTVSGTTITTGTAVKLNSNTSIIGDEVICEKLSDNKVIIMHYEHYNNEYDTNILLCTISNSTITISNTLTYVLSDFNGGYNTVNIGIFNGNKALISSRTKSIALSIDNNTITEIFRNTSLPNHSYRSLFWLNENTAFILDYDSTSTSTGAIYSAFLNPIKGKCVKPAQDSIDGITKTQATTTTKGQVWVLG